MVNRQGSIILLGARGSGKTTVGRSLARATGRGFIDLDEILIERAGLSIAEIFKRYGQPWFRRLESRVLRDALRAASSRSLIIATGGGVVVRQVNRQWMKRAKHTCVYLKCDVAELHRRVAGDASSAMNRPALTGVSGIEEVSVLLGQREPHYVALADIVVDVSTLDTSSVVERVLAAVR